MVSLKSFCIIIATLCCLLIVHPLASKAIIIDKIIAVVNGEIITLSELQELEYSLKNQDPEKLKEVDLTKTLLDKMIDIKLQLQLAAKKKISVSEQQINDALEDIKKQNNLTTNEELKEALLQQGMKLENFTQKLKENILITILFKREVTARVEISEEEINNYFKEHQTYFNKFNELRAQHILFYLPAESTPEQISKKKESVEKVWNMLQKDADFAEMAQKYSDDPSAKKGGDLGFFRRGDMLPALEEAALALKPGEISSVLKTNFGFHIIKLTDYQEHTPENDQKITDEIKQNIFLKKREEISKKWLNKLRKNARIKTMTNN